VSLALATRGRSCTAGGRFVISLTTGGIICISGELVDFIPTFIVSPQSAISLKVYNKEESDIYNKTISISNKQDPNIYNK